MRDDIVEKFKNNTEEEIADAILRFWSDANGLSEALHVYIYK